MCQYLATRGFEVVALSRKALEVRHISFPSGFSVRTPQEMMREGQLAGTDVFIHLAAMNENDCVKFPREAIEVNITQTLQWLELARKAGVKKFVYFSTAHVYGKPLAGYYNENSIAVPVHPYAITHRCAEDYVLAYNADHGMSNVVVRLTNSFGGPAFPTADRWTLLVNDLCKAAVTSGKMALLSDGTQLRDFVCLEDVCMATELFMASDGNGIFNLGSGEAQTVWEMATLIQKVAEEFLRQRIELTRNETKGGIVTQSLEIDISKLKKMGFDLRNNVTAEILATLEYFRTNG